MSGVGLFLFGAILSGVEWYNMSKLKVSGAIYSLWRQERTTIEFVPGNCPE